MKTLKSLFGIVIMTIMALAVQGQAPPFITNGLVAYYPFNGNANDATGNGNNGTLIGTDWIFGTDRFGNTQNALFLNTTSTPSVTLNGAYVSAPRSAALDFSSDFTLSVWVDYESGWTNQQETLISDGNDGFGYIDFGINPGLEALGGNDKFGSGWGGTNSVNGVIEYAPNSWRQLSVVRSGSNTFLFENGSPITNDVSAVAPLNSTTIWFGRFQPVPSGNQNTLQLFGGIDDIRMYSRALSAAEVQQLYAYESTPQIGIERAVIPTFSNIYVGTNYQLQISTNLNGTFTNFGSSFTATNSFMTYPQYFNVANWNQLFFQLQVAP
jgi:hypothetical protein